MTVTRPSGLQLGDYRRDIRLAEVPDLAADEWVFAVEGDAEVVFARHGL